MIDQTKQFYYCIAYSFNNKYLMFGSNSVWQMRFEFKIHFKMLTLLNILSSSKLVFQVACVCFFLQNIKCKL